MYYIPLGTLNEMTFMLSLSLSFIMLFKIKETVALPVCLPRQTAVHKIHYFPFCEVVVNRYFVKESQNKGENIESFHDQTYDCTVKRPACNGF